MSKLIFALKLILVWALVPVVIFLLCEGLASTVFFAERFANTKVVAERLHTDYDPELGWVNIPNTRVDNIYGPGLHVHINSQGYRNEEEFGYDVPPGKVRAICSGDSFTFSFGVSNDQTWCHLLSTLEPRLQTVNMGQGGYGIDQAYLWYKRDGDKVAHDLNIFAFITTDFDRMQRDSFLGYSKPLLQLENNELVLTNVPVPRQAYVLPWLTPAYQPAFDELRSVQWLRRTLFPVQDEQKAPINEPQVRDLAGKVLQEMYRLNRQRGSELVLVYLPVYGDHKPDFKTDTRRRYAEQGAAEMDLVYIDLVESFRELPEDEIGQYFIPNGEIDFPGAAGHYSAEGNAYIAQRLYEELMKQPRLVTLFDAAENDLTSQTRP